MTRDEAIKICREMGWSLAENVVFVDTLVALGVLKLDEPKSAFYQLANEIMLSPSALAAALNRHGLKIVEK